MLSSPFLCLHVLHTSATYVLTHTHICWPAGYMFLVCLPGLLLASRLYSLYKQGGGLPLPSPKKTLAAMVGVLLPRNLPAAAYSLLTLVFAGMSAMCLSATPGEVMNLYPGLHGGFIGSDVWGLGSPSGQPATAHTDCELLVECVRHMHCLATQQASLPMHSMLPFKL